jgi:signal transduction histidine kinase
VTVTVDELRGIDLFEGVSDACLANWAEAAEDRHVEPGEPVLSFGEEGVPFSLLLEGSLDSFFIIDGREEIDHRHVAPTWFGAILALTDQPSITTARAAEPSRVATIEPLPFRRLLADTPEAFVRVMNVFRPVLARIEGATLQREKLAALGQMSAGLAHELNNPAAAAKRTASLLADALDLLDGAIGEFVESGVERADAEVFVRLKREAIARAAEAPERDGLAAADAEDEIGEWLEAHGVADAWRLAEPLAGAGVDTAWLEALETAAGPVLSTAVRWVATSLTARSLSDDLRESTDRMSELVRAIKAYTYMDQADLQEIDVHDGIEATLTMLHHKLKHTDIEVQRRFDPGLPRVCVYGSELNQVWTNLLDNAIDALGRSGTITISTAPWHDTGVEVTIADDGPGIPEEAQRRVFEPFFTTKPVGSGTGLGLDTALRIVRERHDGDLRLRSRPGETAFTVRLPRSPRKGA